jgi:CXXX repeat modification system protein
MEIVKDPKLQVQNFDLTDEQVTTIRKLNSKLVAIRNLITNPDISLNNLAYNRLLDSLAEAQEAYDTWFVELAANLKLTTNPDQKWSIDFTEKVAQLIG